MTCPRCGVATQATVWSKYAWINDGASEKPESSYFVVCSGCDEPSLFESYSDSSKFLQKLSDKNLSPIDILKDGGPRIEKWNKQYPVEKIPDAPKHLPKLPEMFYLEACSCLLNGFPNAAGSMFRKTLEVATLSDEIRGRIPAEVSLKFEKAKLFVRLQMTKEYNIITGSLFDLTDTIRLEGNEAIHGMLIYTIEQAHNLKTFVDAFLNLVFSIPHQIKSVRTANAKLVEI